MEQQLKPEQELEVLRRIKRSATFQRVYDGADGEFVLSEMKKQLRGFDSDPYVHAFNAGLRFWWDFTQNALDADVEKAREVLNTNDKKS